MGIPPGTRCATAYLESLDRRLRDIHDISSHAPCGCDGVSVASNSTGFDDPTWCPHPIDASTREVFEKVLSVLKKSMSELTALIDDMEARVTNSGRVQVGKVKTWLRKSAAVNTLSSKTPEIRLEPPNLANSAGVRRLVPDVLVAIFRQALEDGPRAILRLSQVNKAFRNIALHTPLLWAKIDILQDTSLVALHLERSLDVPLDVSFSLPPMFPDNEGMVRLYTFVTFMAPHSERIRSLNALQSYPTYTRLCLDFIFTSKLPFLKTLQVGLARPRDRNETPEAEPTRDSLPLALTSLSIRHINIATSSNFISPSITTLTLHDTVFSTCAALILALQTMSNLRSLHLENFAIADNAGEVPPQGPVLAELRDMTVIRSSVIVGMQTPKLESITLIGYGRVHFPDNPEDTFPECAPLVYILEENPQLQHLQFSSTALSRSQWKAAFQHLPLLVDIRLARCNFPGDHLMEALGKLCPDGQMPCPRLRHLTIDDEQYITSNAIRSTLVARSSNRGATPLRTLTATRWLTSLINSDDLDTIRQHVGLLAIGITIHREDLESSEEEYTEEEDGQDVDSNASDVETESGVSVGDDGDPGSKLEGEDHKSEQGSLCSDSSSEGSWASGDEMVRCHQFQYEQDAHSSTLPS